DAGGLLPHSRGRSIFFAGGFGSGGFAGAPGFVVTSPAFALPSGVAFRCARRSHTRPPNTAPTSSTITHNASAPRSSQPLDYDAEVVAGTGGGAVRAGAGAGSATDFGGSALGTGSLGVTTLLSHGGGGALGALTSSDFGSSPVRRCCFASACH